MDIGPNLMHILQLTLIGIVCVLLAIFSHVDTTALLTAFIGVSGALSGTHLANNYALMSYRLQTEQQQNATAPIRGRPTAVIIPGGKQQGGGGEGDLPPHA